MRRFASMAVMGLVIALGFIGCSKDKTVQVERYFVELSQAGLAGQAVSEFTIALNGTEAGVTTSATGTATLTLVKSAIEFSIELNNIDSRVQSVGLYIGAPGQTGTRAATLFLGNEPGPINGVLVEGTVLTNDLQGVAFATLVDSMQAGNAYVLVGTLTEPDGELRGQSGPSGSGRFVLSGSRINWGVDGQILSGVTSIGIYSGRAGITGPLRVGLFEGGPTGAIDGNIAGGEFGESDIDGLTLTELLAQMRNGDAYVLVSTSDSPDGTMRGQLFLQF